MANIDALTEDVRDAVSVVESLMTEVEETLRELAQEKDAVITKYIESGEPFDHDEARDALNEVSQRENRVRDLKGALMNAHNYSKSGYSI